jgi:hypothetical protein
VQDDSGNVRASASRARLDDVRDRATCSRDPLWARHPGDSRFHYVDAVTEHCVQTLCNGSWAGCDTVEIDPNPPTETRCGGCAIRLLAAQGVPT